MFDVIIIGAGPAGLSAALWCDELGLDTLVLERGEFVIEERAYDLVCDFYYLQRDLFPRMRAALKEGGFLVAAIHMVDDNPHAKPMNPDFLLRPGELREAFGGLEILHHHETTGHDPDAGEHTRRSAELIARKLSAVSLRLLAAQTES